MVISPTKILLSWPNANSEGYWGRGRGNYWVSYGPPRIYVKEGYKQFLILWVFESNHENKPFLEAYWQTFILWLFLHYDSEKTILYNWY